MERKWVCEKLRNQVRMRQIEHATPDPLDLTPAGATVIGKELLAGCLRQIIDTQGSDPDLTIAVVRQSW